MDFKKILGDRSSYFIPVNDMVSLLKNDIRYKNGSCPVNEEIYLNALKSCSFSDFESKITIKETGVYFDIGILNYYLGISNNVTSVINKLIKYYEGIIDPKNNNSDGYVKYIKNRISIIKDIKSKIETMYEVNDRSEKIDEDKIDERKLKLYIAYHDMEDAKKSNFNSSNFLKSIKLLSDFINNNPELIESNSNFYYYDFEKDEMINCRSVDMVEYVNECVKKNNGNKFNEEDIKNKLDLLEAYLVMEDLRHIDQSVDYYQDYINILTSYLTNNIELLMNDYSYSVIDTKSGKSIEYKISEVLSYVQKLNNKHKKLLIK